MGSQIVSKIMENGTPLVSLQQYQFGDGTGVLSVRIKNDQKGPQTGDVVLDLDDAVISLLDWKSDFPYVKNNVCLYEGMLFRAIVDYPTKGQFIVSEWEELDKVDILAEDFKPNFPYEKNQICIVNHMFYRALDDFMSENMFDIKDWEEIGGATIDDYMMGMHINRWQPVIYNHAIYRALDDFTSSIKGNADEAWESDKFMFEEVRSGDSHWLVESDYLDYSESDKTFSISKSYYQLNSGKLVDYIDYLRHDETIKVVKTRTAKGLDCLITIPIFDFNTLGEIRGATILPDPHYRGVVADQGQMDVITNLRIGDFCDRLDTNSEWNFNGDLWVNTFEPIGTTPHEKIPDNYVQPVYDSDGNNTGWGRVNITDDNLLRKATDSEARARVSNQVVITPLQMGQYGGNLRQVLTLQDLPDTGLVFDLYYVIEEKQFYRWFEGEYVPVNIVIEDFKPGFQYTQNTLITYKGKLYKAKYDFLSDLEFNPVDWVAVGNSIVNNYEGNTSYFAGDIIYYDGSIYRSYNTFISDSDFDPADWEKLTSSTDRILEGGVFEYYVDNNGEDTVEAGSQAKPFKTLNYALSRIKETVQATGSKIILHLANGQEFEYTNPEIFMNLDNIEFKANMKSAIKFTGTKTSLGTREISILVSGDNIIFENIDFSSNIDSGTLFGAIGANIVLKNSVLENEYDIEDGIYSIAENLILEDVEILNNFDNPITVDRAGVIRASNVSIDGGNTPVINDNGMFYAFGAIQNIPDSKEIYSNPYNAIGYYTKDLHPEYINGAYYPKDAQVTYQGVEYRAKDSFISGTDFEPDKWDLIEPIIEEYIPNYFYYKGQLIKRDSEIYQAKENFVSESDFVSDNWEKLADVTSFRDFKAEYNYREGDVIYHGGNVYISKYSFTSGPNWAESDWYSLNKEANTYINDYVPGKEYDKDSVMYYENKIYRATKYVDDSDFFEESWEVIAADKAGKFIPHHFYLEKEIIFFDGTLWISLVDHISGDDFEAGNWEQIKVSATEYKPGDTYYQNQIVIYEGNAYYYPYTIYNESDFDPSKWEPLGSEGSRVFVFDINRYYKKDDVVIYNQRFYRAKQDTTGVFDITKWEPIDEPSVRDFVADQFYPKDALCAYDGSLYRAKDNFTTSTTFDENDWIVVSGAGASVQNYTEGIKFKENDLTVYKQRLYQAKEDFTSGATFDITKWTPVDESAVRNFVPNQFYPKDAICANSSALYRAKANFTSGATFNAADWEAISDIRIHVDPLDNTTEYLLTTAPYGSAAPTPVAGKTVICLYTEN